MLILLIFIFSSASTKKHGLQRHSLFYLLGSGGVVSTTGFRSSHNNLHVSPSVAARSNPPPPRPSSFVSLQYQHPRQWSTMTILHSSSSSSNTDTLYYPRIDTTENAIRDTDALQSWATSVCGIQQLDGLTFYSSDCTDSNGNSNDNNDDIAMATMVDITAGTCILYVPSLAVISSTNVQQEYHPPMLFEKPEQLLDNLLTTSGSSSSSSSDQYSLFYLFFKLLIEYERGTQSDWYTYLNSLPRLYNTGSSLTPSCYDCLSPLAAKLCMEQRVRCINMRQALKTIPQEILTQYVTSETLTNDELLKWIYNVVETRSVIVNEGKERILVPMVDMFNHASNGHEVELTYDVTSGDCYMYTITDVPAQSTLHTSYGEYHHTNPSATFAKYGFIDTSCIASYCKMMNIIPSTELRNIGLSYSRMLFYRDTGDISEEVYDVLLYQILSENSNWQAQREFYTACTTNDTQLKSDYHAMYMSQTMIKLKNHVDTFLQDLDDLYDKARTKDAMKHPRLPLILAHNDYIRSTFITVKDKIDPIVAML